MSKERELLRRISSHSESRIPLHFIKEIQQLLARPEQDNIQYLLDQVARLTAENAMLKEKWSTPKPESEQQPEAWIIVNRDTGYRIQVSLFPDLYNKDMFEVIPLYTSPPKRERINHDDILDRSIDGSFEYRDGFMDGVMFAENHHDIGVDDEN